MINQLTLGVSLKDEATFANYYPGENGPLIQALQQAASGSGERVIYFSGVGGEGCTHLLQACCHEAQQHQVTAAYIPLANCEDFTPEIFEGLESLMLVCVDDIHNIAGRPEWEEAFFHLYNRIHDIGGRLVMSANAMPKSLPVSMPDVKSRLAWGVVFQLQALTDAEKLSVLIMRAQRRGITLSEDVGKFVLTHFPRHMSSLFTALETLDNASLAAQRKLTIPFVKTVLQI